MSTPSTTSTPASQRLQTLTSHLSPPNMTDQKRPPITCHVLDTTLGKPGASIPVTLFLLPPTSSTSTAPIAQFTATTNSDGRVTAWTSASSTPFTETQSLEQIWADASTGDLKWKLRFDTDKYFGDRGISAFFPEVEVVFVVREGHRGEHFHVPVLLGPFGYTTYRGS